MRKTPDIKYENRIVAFVDILGFKEMIKRSESSLKTLKLLYQALEFLKRRENALKWTLRFVEIEEDAQKKGISSFDIQSLTTCTCFSDSIVVSVRCNERNINEITSTLLANLSFVGAKLMTEGILLRGGITVGKLIHLENGTLMGQGVIDAWQLETSSAKFPRILVSNQLIEKLNYPLSAKMNRYPYHQYLQRFEDGCVGFHQMIYFQVIQSIDTLDKRKLKKDLAKIKQTIVRGLDENFERSDIHLKYLWLKKEYERLSILAVDKERIYNLNEDISGQNIHYSCTDDFYRTRQLKKGNVKP